MSRKPSVASSAVRAPRRSITAFVASVVPCTNTATSEKPVPGIRQDQPHSVENRLLGPLRRGQQLARQPSPTLLQHHVRERAVDIGGTFTDVVLLAGGRGYVAKLLTTPREPEVAVIEGARSALAEAGLAFGDIGVFVHGTTLATNAIIERKGARTALIATDGFRDVIEIADESRFDQYDINIVKSRPLVPRELRFTVPERMDVHGAVRRPLDEGAVRAVARRLAELGIEAVAVALIHAYANPAHEARIGEILAERAARIGVTLSSEACPETREYERTSTAIANAYVRPLMSGYLARCSASSGSSGFARPIHSMTSGGGLASLETARRFPVRLVESGPCRRRHPGGAASRSSAASAACCRFDMGGTTAKICLIDDCEPRRRACSRWTASALHEGQRPAGAHPRDRDGGDRRRRRLDRRASMPCSASRSGRTAPAPSRGPPATAAAARRRP